MQRAVAAAFLSGNTCILHNAGHSADEMAILEIIRNLGSKVTYISESTVEVVSNYKEVISGPPIVVDCGESGLGVRMLTSILATLDRDVIITGQGSLLRRPLHFFGITLPLLGVPYASNDNFLPLQLKGPIMPADIEIDGSLSSQYLTGLLMAYSAAGASEKVIHVHNLVSRPYIDLTLNVMKAFGMKCPENVQYQQFRFTAEINASPKGTIHYSVEGDWSGASFWLVAGAIGGPVVISGLSCTSSQADKAILDVLKVCGARVEMHGGNITVSCNRLMPFVFDATDSPDLFPPLVALAAYCQGISRITGCSRLTHKESNRAIALEKEFGKMGITIAIEGDEMIIYGGSPIQSALVSSHNDHRIAMACAIAAIKSGGPVTIQGADAVKKSYPDFFADLASLGVRIDPVVH